MNRDIVIDEAEFIRLFPFTPNKDLETIFKINEWQVTWFAKKLNVSKSDEYKKYIQGQRAIGHTLSQEVRDRIAASRRGKKMSKETIAKIYETKKRTGALNKGEKAYNWKGGRPWERFKNPEYIKWRTSVLERDDYTCQKCGKKCKKREKGLAAHHIQPYKDFPDLRFDINNGVTMCRVCHMELHGRPFRQLEPIPCACGCGELIPPVDPYGRERRYKNHHWNKRSIDSQELNE